MPVHRKLDDILVIITDPFFIGAEPDDTGIVAVNGYKTVLADAFYIFGSIFKIPYRTCFLTQQVYATMIGDDPDDAVIILLDAGNEIGV